MPSETSLRTSLQRFNPHHPLQQVVTAMVKARISCPLAQLMAQLLEQSLARFPCSHTLFHLSLHKIAHKHIPGNVYIVAELLFAIVANDVLWLAWCSIPGPCFAMCCNVVHSVLLQRVHNDQH